MASATGSSSRPSSFADVPETAIKVRHISKVFDLGLSGRTKSLATIVRERARHPFRGGVKRERLFAVDDVTFDVAEGEAVGVIGNNGAGKSTLLKILSRITPPSGGYIDMRGTVGALLEVGTGFHPKLTGMENIYLNGTILGMTKRDIDRRLDEIIAFSEVDRFLETPVKRYSSGMRVRLAFAVAAHLDPQILIVDEILSVGDYAFQAKCLEKMRSIVAEQGRTVLFVSHNLTTVEHFCPRTILMDAGRVVIDGPTDEAIAKFLRQFPMPGAVRELVSSTSLLETARAAAIVRCSRPWNFDPRVGSLRTPFARVSGCRWRSWSSTSARSSNPTSRSPSAPVRTLACSG